MTDRHRMLSGRWVRAVGPVLPIALFGAAWIVLHAGAGRAGTHTLFQVLALAECTIALLLRGRKPLGALASILVMYALADLDTILILPVLLAVATVADRRERPTAAAATLITASVVVAMPFLHGDKVSILTGTLPHLAAVMLAAGLGAWVREHRHPVIPQLPSGAGRPATA
jgi:hypothetical protein